MILSFAITSITSWPNNLRLVIRSASMGGGVGKGLGNACLESNGPGGGGGGIPRGVNGVFVDGVVRSLVGVIV